MHQPHFDIHAISNHSSAVREEAGTCLVRTAACLTALLQGPTAAAGLNESRYNVLDSLRRIPGATCTQTELAARLLQSESNLSTLLERMRQDELISRVRSETDRRKSLIGLTRAGLDALDRADLARSRATANIFKSLDESQQAALCAALGLLLQRCENELGVAAPRTSRVTPRGNSGAAAMNSEHRPFQGSSLISDGLTT
jgi:DNA-binding MarR family transcriptional regulator